MNHLFIITHTDLDGIGSAVAYLKLVRRGLSETTVLFSEPYELHETLKLVVENAEKSDRLAIMDLGPNEKNYNIIIDLIKKIVNKDVLVEWYDHHIWEDEGKSLKNVGIKMFIDRSTCATGVVVRYASKIYNRQVDDFLVELVKAVCAADLWKWDHFMAPKLFRVVGSDKGSQSDEWRFRVLEKFLSEKLWDDELQEKLEGYVNKELRGYEKVLRTLYVKRFREFTLVSVVKPRGPPANSLIGAMLLSRLNADIAIIGRENGAMSLRSKNIDVQKIARFLGGGGHPRAAGAKIRIPFLVKFISGLYPRLLSRYMTRCVINALKSI